MSDPARFLIDVKEFAEKAKGMLRQAAAETIQDIAEEVVVRSPFEYGFLKGSWYPTLNEPGGAGPAGIKDPTGGVLVARLAVILPSLKLGDTLYYLNNAAYAARLEYGYTGPDSLGRTFNQPPRAYVRGTMAEGPRIALEAAARVAAGGGGGRFRGGGGVRPDVGYDFVDAATP